MEVPDPESMLADPSGMSLCVAVFPTLPRNGHIGTVGAYWISNASNMLTGSRQAIMGNLDIENGRGWALTLDDGRPAFNFAVGGVLHTARLETELAAHHWYRVAVTVPPGAGNIAFECTPLGHIADLHVPAAAGLEPETAQEYTSGGCTTAALPFRIGVLTARDGDRLPLVRRLQRKDRWRDGRSFRRGGLVPVARWHFGRSERADGLLLSRVIDESPNRLTVNASTGPMRAVTGPRFQRLDAGFSAGAR